MGDVINLHLARKAKARSDKAARAAGNRARFGRTRAERAADENDRMRLDARLDGAKRERSPTED